MVTKGKDVVVIGSGIIGATIGYLLSREGLSVTVMDGGGVGAGSGATGHGHGMITLGPGSLFPGPHYALGVASAEMYPGFVEQLSADSGVDPMYHELPELWPALNEEEQENLHDHFVKNGSQPATMKWISGDECRAIEPRIAPDVIGGFSLRGAQVDAHLMAQAGVSALQRSGGEILDSNATGLVINGSRVTGVMHAAGTLEADLVVMAMGASAYQAKEWIGFPVPVRPLHGEVLHVRLPGEPLRAFILTRRHGPIIPRRDGSILVGSIYGSVAKPEKPVDGIELLEPPEGWFFDPADESPLVFDMEPTPEARDLMFSSSARILPALENAEIVEHRSGVRPVSADRLPIIGPVPGTDGVVVATGHGTKGIHLAPVTAALTADYVLHGKSLQEFPAEAFLPARFA